jgi:FG-GAP-like repeat/Secretion system C-terminal sorting domain
MKYILPAAWALLMYFFLLPSQAQQHTFRYRNDVKIVIDSDTVKDPWVGGLNSPVFSRIDLNQDGMEDLVAFDRSHRKLYTFLARRQPQGWEWQYAPAYEYLFPRDLDGWVLLRDYDRDGRRDLFTKTSLGIKVYRNTTPEPGPLAFAEAESFLTFDGNINLQASSENLPAIGDMDGDGDLDVLTFNFATSSNIEYYRNLQQDEGLPATRLKYTLATGRWGGLSRCHSHECHAYVFNGACRTDGTRHNAGTTLLALDLDGDADQDVLLGSEACPDLVQITNSGTATEGQLTAAGLQRVFPANTTPANFEAFPAAYFEDVSFDGLPDLLVAPFARSNAGEAIDFAHSSWYYQNTGRPGQPAFAFRQPDFLQQHMVDAGEASAPALGDVDGDGDADLLVGTRQGRIWFFRNVGTAARAVFALVSRDYQDLSAAGWRELRPQLADLNGDGRPDLVLAGTTAAGGAIGYIPNTAAFGQPARFAASQLQALAVAAGTPAFYDLDGDGDKDLVLAASLPPTPTSGALQYYRNTGTRSQPAFTLAQDSWGAIPAELSRRHLFPLLADLNRDNKPELLLADDTGELRVYRNLPGEPGATFIPVKEVFVHPGTQAYVPLQLGGSGTLAAADLDGDQVPELVAGSQGGGLVLLGQEMAGTAPLEPVSFQLYPNPASGWFKVVSDEEVVVSVLNGAGQVVKASGSTFRKVHQLDTRDLSAGLYLVQVRTAAHKQSGHKLVVFKW